MKILIYEEIRIHIKNRLLTVGTGSSAFTCYMILLLLRTIWFQLTMSENHTAECFSPIQLGLFLQVSQNILITNNLKTIAKEYEIKQTRKYFHKKCIGILLCWKFPPKQIRFSLYSIIIDVTRRSTRSRS